MSESECNTERLVTKSSSMRHMEGGWPKDVDPSEMSDMQRFRKKAEKDEEYKTAMKLLGPMIGRCMKQNNTINIYEEVRRDKYIYSRGTMVLRRRVGLKAP
jgi:dynein intermediate chain 2